MDYAAVLLVGVLFGWWLTRPPLNSLGKRLHKVEDDIDWLIERHNMHTHRDTVQPNLRWPGLELSDEQEARRAETADTCGPGS